MRAPAFWWRKQQGRSRAARTARRRLWRCRGLPPAPARRGRAGPGDLPSAIRRRRRRQDAGPRSPPRGCSPPPGAAGLLSRGYGGRLRGPVTSPEHSSRKRLRRRAAAAGHARRRPSWRDDRVAGCTPRLRKRRERDRHGRRVPESIPGQGLFGDCGGQPPRRRQRKACSRPPLRAPLRRSSRGRTRCCWWGKHPIAARSRAPRIRAAGRCSCAARTGREAIAALAGRRCSPRRHRRPGQVLRDIGGSGNRRCGNASFPDHTPMRRRKPLRAARCRRDGLLWRQPKRTSSPAGQTRSRRRRAVRASCLSRLRSQEADDFRRCTLDAIRS